MHLNLHVTYSCTFIHMYLQFFIFWYIVVGAFLIVFFSLSPSLSFFQLVASWHLNKSPFHPRTLFVLRHLLLLLILPLPLFSSMMTKPERTFRRTFLDEIFIWNAKPFCQISLTLTYPLSSTIGVGSHSVTSWSLVPPWSYRSSTPICTDSIIQHLILSLTFEVCSL